MIIIIRRQLTLLTVRQELSHTDHKRTLSTNDQTRTVRIRAIKTLHILMPRLSAIGQVRWPIKL